MKESFVLAQRGPTGSSVHIMQSLLIFVCTYTRPEARGGALGSRIKRVRLRLKKARANKGLDKIIVSKFDFGEFCVLAEVL